MTPVHRRRRRSPHQGDPIVELSDVDLLDPDVFRTGRHHEMFRGAAGRGPDPLDRRARRLRLLEHHPPRRPDRRSTATPQLFSSAEHGISIPDIGRRGRHGARDDALHGPAAAHAVPPAGQQGLHAPHDRPARDRPAHQVASSSSTTWSSRASATSSIDIAAELPLQAIAELMGVPGRGPPQAVRLDEPDDRHRRPRVRGRPRRRPARPPPSCTCTPTSLAAEKRQPLSDDILSKLLGAEIDGDALSETEFDMFFMLLVGRRQRDHPQRHLARHAGPARQPRPVRQAARPTPSCCPAPSRRSCAGPRRCCTSAAPPLEDYELGGKQIKQGRQGRHLAHLGQPRRGRVRRSRSASTSSARPTSTSPSVAAAPTSASAPTWPAWSST